MATTTDKQDREKQHQHAHSELIKEWGKTANLHHQFLIVSNWSEQAFMQQMPGNVLKEKMV